MRTRLAPVSLQLAFLVCAAAAWPALLSAEQRWATLPVGAVRIAIEGGTAGAPKLTSFGIPLYPLSLAPGMASGRIAALSPNTLTVRAAKLTPDSLGTGTAPYSVRILSGTAAGEWLPILTNTSDTLVLATDDLRERGLRTGESGDIVEIVRLHTLDSFFGSTTLQGGTSAANADIVSIGLHLRDSYYFNSTDRKWRRADGRSSADAGRTPLHPEALIQVARRGPSLVLVATGRVVDAPRRLPIANSGKTYTHVGTYLDTTLSAIAFQRSLPNWISSQTPALADQLAILQGASWKSYYHDGYRWMETQPVGTAAPATADAVVVPAGAPVIINRPNEASGFSWLEQSLTGSTATIE